MSSMAKGMVFCVVLCVGATVGLLADYLLPRPVAPTVRVTTTASPPQRGTRVFVPRVSRVIVCTEEQLMHEWIRLGGSIYEIPLAFYNRQNQEIWIIYQESVAFFERIMGHEFLHGLGLNHERGAWDLVPLQLDLP